MEFMKKIRKVTGLKNYGLHKKLVERGYKITLPGLDHYDQPTSRSIRKDVLAGISDICCDEYGMSRPDFWAMVDKSLDEFRPKRGRK